MFPFTFPNIYRLARIKLPDWTAETLLTIALTSAGLSTEELVKVDGVLLLGVETSAGIAKTPAGWKAAISGTNLRITVPASGPVDYDVITVAYTMGAMPLHTAGVLSTP